VHVQQVWVHRNARRQQPHRALVNNDIATTTSAAVNNDIATTTSAAAASRRRKVAAAAVAVRVAGCGIAGRQNKHADEQKAPANGRLVWLR
jgi:hypothetical protein